MPRHHMKTLNNPPCILRLRNLKTEVCIICFPSTCYATGILKRHKQRSLTRVQTVCACARSLFANANFTTRMPVFELKSNFISIQNFKARNVKPPGMLEQGFLESAPRSCKKAAHLDKFVHRRSQCLCSISE